MDFKRLFLMTVDLLKLIFMTLRNTTHMKMGTSAKKWQIQNRVIDLIMVNVGTNDTLRAKCLLTPMNYNILHSFIF